MFFVDPNRDNDSKRPSQLMFVPFPFSVVNSIQDVDRAEAKRLRLVPLSDHCGGGSRIPEVVLRRTRRRCAE